MNMVLAVEQNETDQTFCKFMRQEFSTSSYALCVFPNLSLVRSHVIAKCLMCLLTKAYFFTRTHFGVHCIAGATTVTAARDKPLCSLIHTAVSGFPGLSLTVFVCFGLSLVMEQKLKTVRAPQNISCTMGRICSEGPRPVHP